MELISKGLLQYIYIDLFNYIYKLCNNLYNL